MWVWWTVLLIMRFWQLRHAGATSVDLQEKLVVVQYHADQVEEIKVLLLHDGLQVEAAIVLCHVGL